MRCPNSKSQGARWPDGPLKYQMTLKWAQPFVWHGWVKGTGHLRAKVTPKESHSVTGDEAVIYMPWRDGGLIIQKQSPTENNLFSISLGFSLCLSCQNDTFTETVLSGNKDFHLWFPQLLWSSSDIALRFTLDFLRRCSMKTQKATGTCLWITWQLQPSTYGFKTKLHISHKETNKNRILFPKVWSILRDMVTKGCYQLGPLNGREKTNG